MNSIGGRYQMSARFYRHVFLLAFDQFECATVSRIFSAICDWHFSLGFSDKVTTLAKVWVTESICNIRPTTCFHFYLPLNYIFRVLHLPCVHFTSK